ncbi:endospore germination permease [Paenibacillus sp. WQ 127069]|uniref:Endospore germination permease n=1 Tax=Paenibacillus baimaensis TaxID=2982185 RepID=A0ABT2URI0_9BACL|nr:endospore germination permease [Paenibacillus sp. WQ 127069]MCU6796616.1 endospore germination permease [Paenibacillus sp. WQ 127069]
MERVSQSQIYMLFSNFLFTTTLGFFMSTHVKNAHYMAWLSLIMGAAIGIMITYLAYRLAIKRPTQFLGNYGKEILGKWLHYPLIFILIFNFLFAAATVLRQLQDFMNEVYLPATPEWAVTAMFGICVAYAVRSGVETIFRSSQGIFFLSIAGVLIVPFFVHKEINYHMAIAMLNHFDIKGIWSGTYMITALYAEMVFIPFLFPYFTCNNKTMRSLTWAMVTSVFIVLTNLIPMILVFGPDLTASLQYPQLELIRYIRAGSSLENLDPVLIAIWLASLFIKICLFLYLAVICLTHTFSLKDHKPFSFSMTAMVLGLSLYMVRSKPEFDDLYRHGEFTFLLFTEMIPIVYLLVDRFRSSRVKQV